MRHYTCDICGCELPHGQLRYAARIEVFAAYDTLEIRREDLEKDLDAELRSLFARLKNVDPDKLLRDVYADFSFDLCPRCHGEYVRDPLAGFTGEAGQAEG
ncbi:MAG: hypothetical protein PHN82_11305 [bacterium]|nr:hypothetical protein [bacterium]